MNFPQAAATGREFKRKGWKGYWYSLDPQAPLALFNEHQGRVNISAEDILANDWEVREQTVQVTRSKYLDAVGEAMKDVHGKLPNQHIGTGFTPYEMSTFIDALATKLGLDSF